MRYTDEHHVAGQQYVAILTVPSDTYRGVLTRTDITPGSKLNVALDGRGRHHTLEVGLDVRIEDGPASGTTSLAYDARVHVGGPAGATDHLMRSCSRAVLMTALSVSRS